MKVYKIVEDVVDLIKQINLEVELGYMIKEN